MKYLSMVSKDELIELIGNKLTRCFHDNFMTTETLNEDVTNTGYVEYKFGEITMHTGLTTNSEAILWYDSKSFNPLFSQLLIKARINDLNNTFAFIGFKDTLTEPTFNMTESHSGFMFYDDGIKPAMYYSTADGYTQQRVIIEGFDPTNYLVYKIEGNKFSIRQLSIIVPYFNGLQTLTKARDWKFLGSCDSYPPTNGTHYMIIYIMNSSNKERFLRMEHITYAEDYSD